MNIYLDDGIYLLGLHLKLTKSVNNLNYFIGKIPLKDPIREFYYILLFTYLHFLPETINHPLVKVYLYKTCRASLEILAILFSSKLPLLLCQTLEI